MRNISLFVETEIEIEREYRARNKSDSQLVTDAECPLTLCFRWKHRKKVCPSQEATYSRQFMMKFNIPVSLSRFFDVEEFSHIERRGSVF